jgi:hypothetical protein
MCKSSPMGFASRNTHYWVFLRLGAAALERKVHGRESPVEFRIFTPQGSTERAQGLVSRR